MTNKTITTQYTNKTFDTIEKVKKSPMFCLLVIGSENRYINNLSLNFGGAQRSLSLHNAHYHKTEIILSTCI